jgi:hypothetical protein
LKKRMILAAMLIAPLAACGGNGDDKLAERVEDAADNRADAMEAQAEALEEKAEQVRDTGESRSDAIDAADVNAQAMSQERRDAIVANEAAAVR